MFTLSFSHHNTSDKTVVQGARYTVCQGPGYVSIWIYPTIKAELPICMEVRPTAVDETYFEVFITNDTGKTIDRFRAYEPLKAA